MEAGRTGQSGVTVVPSVTMALTSEIEVVTVRFRCTMAMNVLVPALKRRFVSL